MHVIRAVRIRARGSGPATLVAPVIFLAGVAVGWASLAQSTLLDDASWVQPEPTGFGELFWPIAGRNLGAALLLFSGTCTAGFSTVVALGLMSTYVGATFGAAADNVGVGDALASIAIYAPIEFAGLLLAATAGVMPVVALVRGAFAERAHDSPLTAYVAELGPAIRCWCCAAVLIVAGAVVESIVIASR